MGDSERQQIFPHDNQHIITSKGRDSDVERSANFEKYLKTEEYN